MPLLSKRPFAAAKLELGGDNLVNHVFEPEFHQTIYVEACESAAASKGSFQLGDATKVVRYPNRGIQPDYCDDESDAESLVYIGMRRNDGSVVTPAETSNVCALKSVSIRWGFVDFGVARAVNDKFFQAKKQKNAAQYGDVLVNSTGDGTIGRVAVYNRSHPAIVDGHITIVRLKDVKLAWYVAAYLLSVQGQRQLYRYINGSSGQVEIYPQDIARVWVPGGSSASAVAQIGKDFAGAVQKYDEFQAELNKVLAQV